MPQVQAVLVLYKLRPEDSLAWQSLQVVARVVAPDALPTLLVYDNSPVAQTLPPSAVPTQYVSDVTNSGLAQAYNTALERAQANGSEWLLLLDQDTVLTAEYWAEVVATLPQVPQEAVAVVPRLLEGTLVHSPTGLPRMTHVPVAASSSGFLPGPVTAYNSGALFRTGALKAAGAFDPQFPLEFADHAVFHALQAAGGRVWLLRARLEHRLSTEQLGTEATADRYLRMLQAERDFYRTYGSAADELFYHLRRGRQAAGQLLKVQDKRFALLSLRAALGMLPPTAPRKPRT